MRPWIRLVGLNCYDVRPSGTSARETGQGLDTEWTEWTMAVALVISSCTVNLSVVVTSAHKRTDRRTETNAQTTHAA